MFLASVLQYYTTFLVKEDRGIPKHPSPILGSRDFNHPGAKQEKRRVLFKWVSLKNILQDLGKQLHRRLINQGPKLHSVGTNKSNLLICAFTVAPERGDRCHY